MATALTSRSSAAGTRPSRFSRRVSRRTVAPTYALFGFGGGKKDSEADRAKEEAWAAQQELLERRRSGAAIEEAKVRRQNVKDTVAARKAERRREKELLAQGVMPETLANWKPYQNKQDEKADSGIVIPLLPFGIKKYDEGERFDLRSPYADDGWVDPEELDMFAGIKRAGKKLLNFGGNPVEDQRGKPILWASDFGKKKKEDGDKQK